MRWFYTLVVIVILAVIVIFALQNLGPVSVQFLSVSLELPIAVFTIASGAIILIPTWLWSIGLISNIDPEMYRVIWWGMGHSSQQINVSAPVAIWYAIGALVLGAKPC